MRRSGRAGLGLAVALSLACLGAAPAGRSSETVRFGTEDGFALTAELWKAPAPGAPVALWLDAGRSFITRIAP